MMHLLRFPLPLLAMIVLPTVARVNGALANPLCGPNSVFCYNAGTFTTTDPSKSCSDPFCSASYDLVRGAFEVAYVPGGLSSVAAVDQYRVEGVSPGTPLSFSAELDVNLRVFPYNCFQAGSPPPTSSASARLREGDSNLSSAAITTPIQCNPGYCCPLAKALDQTLRVTVTRSAGELFTLRFDFATSGSGSGQASGRLRFSGLPPGAFVTSCQGFGQDLVTAATGVTWGRLKLLYR